VDLVLQRMKRKIFEEYGVDTVTVDIDYIKETRTISLHLSGSEDEEVEDNPCDIQIAEGEGERGLEGPQLQSKEFTAPMIKKVNIGTEEKPKIANIGDYWDSETMEKIIELLRKYNDLFPTTFSEMKGVAGKLGEMKIPLRPDAKPVRQRLYRLNPIYKKKVKA